MFNKWIAFIIDSLHISTVHTVKLEVGDIIIQRKTGRMAKIVMANCIMWFDNNETNIDWGAVEGGEPKLTRENFRLATEKEIAEIII